MVNVDIIDIYKFGALSFKLLKAISEGSKNPTVTLPAPEGTVILGGGAFVDWDGPYSPPSSPGNLLTAMYPNDDGTSWTVASKDHLYENMARIVAYSIVAQMEDGSPISGDNYKVVSATSEAAQHPKMQVDLPDGFTVVGGGARTNFAGNGSLLFASYPTVGLRGWVAAAKDHYEPDEATVTVWAIGLKDSFLQQAGMVVKSFESTSAPPANHPRNTLVVPALHLTGAGARVDWNDAGNLLTASFPQDRQTVIAEGKDHIIEDRGNITAYAIGFKA